MVSARLHTSLNLAPKGRSVTKVNGSQTNLMVEGGKSSEPKHLAKIESMMANSKMDFATDMEF
jgi:hypothetical protein